MQDIITISNKKIVSQFMDSIAFDGPLLSPHETIKNLPSSKNGTNSIFPHEITEKWQLNFSVLQAGNSNGKIIMFTNGNEWYIKSLILNLLASYNMWNTKLNRKIGVFCSDKQGYDTGVSLGIDCCLVDIPELSVNNLLNNTDCNTNLEGYIRLSFVKTVLIHYALSLGYTVLYIDPDMAFNNRHEKLDYIDSLLKGVNALTYIFDDKQFVTGYKKLKCYDSIIAGSLLRNNDKLYVYLNTNLILAKPTEYNLSLYRLDKASIERISKMPNGGDEVFINRVGRPYEHISFWNDKIYPPGNNAVQYKDTAYMFHANCVSGLDNKIKLLQACGGWYLTDFSVPRKIQGQIEYNSLTLSEWQKLHKPESELIVQASVIDGSDRMTNVSIGMCYHYVYQQGKSESCQIGSHDNLVLCAIKIDTDRSRRGSSTLNRERIIWTLEINGITNVVIPTDKYYETLTKYKFIISPEGNGIDCHRHYEALLAGCIPIIEDNPDIRKKYGNCPILYTKDYSEITPAYLEKKYEEMINEKYDFTKLLLSYWDIEEQKNIKTRGNFWCLRTTGKIWYK